MAPTDVDVLRTLAMDATQDVSIGVAVPDEVHVPDTNTTRLSKEAVAVVVSTLVKDTTQIAPTQVAVANRLQALSQATNVKQDLHKPVTPTMLPAPWNEAMEVVTPLQKRKPQDIIDLAVFPKSIPPQKARRSHATPLPPTSFRFTDTLPYTDNVSPKLHGMRCVEEHLKVCFPNMCPVFPEMTEFFEQFISIVVL